MAPFIPFHGEVGDSKTGDDPLEVQLYGVISTTEAGELAKCTRERPVLLASCTGVLGCDEPCERLNDVGDMTGERTTSGPSRPEGSRVTPRVRRLLIGKPEVG